MKKMNKPIHFVTKQFKKFRVDRGWSQQEMAEFLALQMNRKVSQVMVAYWETQTRGMMAEQALELSRALKVPVADLFEQKPVK